MEITAARVEDMPFIASEIERLGLDGEGLDAGQFLVARHKGEVAGFGRIKDHGDFYEMASLAVVEADRGRSIGKNLAEELIRRCRSKRLYLVTDIPSFFEKFNFELIREGIPPPLNEKIVEFCDSASSGTVVAMVLEEKGRGWTPYPTG